MDNQLDAMMYFIVFVLLLIAFAAGLVVGRKINCNPNSVVRQHGVIFIDMDVVNPVDAEAIIAKQTPVVIRYSSHENRIYNTSISNAVVFK